MKSTRHTVLITGGATGIGFALAAKFHAHGDHVILVGRTESALANAVKALPGAEFVVADVANAQDRDRLVRMHPGVTVLINNAGIRVVTPFDQASESELTRELEVNFLAPVLLARAYLPLLEQHAEAAIVNVTSGVALWPRETAAMYCASKAALHSFSKSLRWQLEARGVRVFEVLPPMVATAMAGGRDQDAISPARLADEFWDGFQSDRFEMPIGKVKLLHWLRRLSPSLTDRQMRVQR